MAILRLVGGVGRLGRRSRKESVLLLAHGGVRYSVCDKRIQLPPHFGASSLIAEEMQQGLPQLMPRQPLVIKVSFQRMAEGVLLIHSLLLGRT